MTWLNLRFSFLAVSLLAVASAQDVMTADLPHASEPAAITQLFFAEREPGQVVYPITESDLKLLDNNKPPQSILAIRTANELPLRLGLVIDTSNSEQKNRLYQPTMRAALDFLDQAAAAPDARVFIISFDKTPNASRFMAHDELSKFTPDLTLGGGTALFDAVYFACADRIATDPEWPTRRVLVILSDGHDNSSHIRFGEALSVAQQTRTAIFVVDIGEGGPIASDEIRLKSFGEGTGGFAYLHPGGDTTKVFSEIKRQIENMHLITYVPAGTTKQRSYHSFKLVPAQDKKLRIRAPLGFYAGTSRR